MRRIATKAIVCALAARLLAACGDGSVSGQDPLPDDGGTRQYPLLTDDADVDGPGELWDDSGTKTKGDRDAQAPSDVVHGDRPAAPDPCAARDDGTYCAGLVGLPSTGLLRCAAHHSADVTTCPGGCIDRPGATDACLDDTIEPCFNERDGLYCGRTIGSTTRPNDAIRCAYHRTTWTGTCTGGCSMTATGVTCATP